MPLGTHMSPWPSYDQDEIDAATAVLRSGRVNYWTGGECRAFEEEFADFAGTRHAVALANGTLALEAAWRTLGIGAGDEVICTPRSFVASASTIAACGARPVFADVDPDSQNITPETVAPLIGARTRAILCVHLAGWPCDMDGFADLASAHGIHLVEDCAQAHGAAIGGRSVGSFGDIAAWSFCQDKIITTGGEGGMVTMASEPLMEAAWSLKDHGKSYDAVHRRNHPPGFRWLVESLGSNWRMTEMQAAIGRAQLRKMPEWHARRNENAAALADALVEEPALRVPMPSGEIRHAWYRFYCFVRPEALADGWNRDRMIGEIAAAGVPAFAGTCPEIYREKVFADIGVAPETRLANALTLGETSICLLVHPTLTGKEIARTGDVVRDVARNALR